MRNILYIEGDKMIKLMTRFFLFSLLLFLLTGCVSTGKYRNIPDGAELTLPTPERTILDKKSVPAETKLVCAAIINTLRHREEDSFCTVFLGGRGESADGKIRL